MNLFFVEYVCTDYLLKKISANLVWPSFQNDSAYIKVQVIRNEIYLHFCQLSQKNSKILFGLGLQI